MNNMGHKISAQHHARHRFQERAGIHFNHAEARRLIGELKNHRYGICYQPPDQDRIWYHMDYQNPKETQGKHFFLWVCYCPILDRIVTVLRVKPNNVPLSAIRDLYRAKTRRQKEWKEALTKNSINANLITEAVK